MELLLVLVACNNGTAGGTERDNIDLRVVPYRHVTIVCHKFLEKEQFWDILFFPKHEMIMQNTQESDNSILQDIISIKTLLLFSAIIIILFFINSFISFD